MVTLSSTQRYYLWLEPIDMRKSFDGLQGLVTGELGRDALSGEVLPWADLLLILEGVSLKSVRWRKRYQRLAPEKIAK